MCRKHGDSFLVEFIRLSGIEIGPLIKERSILEWMYERLS